ncbi:eukaryotic initiation factor 4A-1-like [Prunus yedoensis var. nudiflora]|uniref:Eukaryotic initiation factor 4A-1-like n=1 Tax=Prunus yedoensis var. nudiflora TaxID=2094558 RepID=A0A314XSX2_PRUYE|nr:eukaryotic initiation factor 4A-1-like [Prunus yedoensis var. nudiflora]
MRALGYYLGLRVYACVRGRTRHEDQRILHAGVHVVVGTPDCVFEMLSSQNLYPDHIGMIVLDEAGEMLTGSFNDEILHIFQLLPSPVQVGVFSATMPPEVLEVTRKFMTKPVRIVVEHDELTLEGIKQFYFNVEEEEWKLDTVCKLRHSLSTYPTVIFVDTTHKVEWLTDRMIGLDYTVSAIHVDTDLNTRDTILREFALALAKFLSPQITWLGVSMCSKHVL